MLKIVLNKLRPYLADLTGSILAGVFVILYLSYPVVFDAILIPLAIVLVVYAFWAQG